MVNDPNFNQSLELTGNNCSESSPDFWDLDEDGWTPCGGDCDDGNPFINPEATELLGNDLDDNCNGIIDGDTDDISDPAIDDDGDGYSENDGDCHDDNADISPDAEDTPNNIDDNCDGIIDENTIYTDDDEDGWTEREGDCDDSDAKFSQTPSIQKTVLTTIATVLLMKARFEIDDDGDGFSDNDGDCNDSDPWTYPDAIEDCDNVDNNCNGEIDEGNAEEETDACGFISERSAMAEPEEKGCQVMIWLSSKSNHSLASNLVFWICTAAVFALKNGEMTLPIKIQRELSRKNRLLASRRLAYRRCNFYYF